MPEYTPEYTIDEEIALKRPNELRLTRLDGTPLTINFNLVVGREPTKSSIKPTSNSQRTLIQSISEKAKSFNINSNYYLCYDFYYSSFYQIKLLVNGSKKRSRAISYPSQESTILYAATNESHTFEVVQTLDDIESALKEGIEDLHPKGLEYLEEIENKIRKETDQAIDKALSNIKQHQELSWAKQKTVSWPDIPHPIELKHE